MANPKKKFSKYYNKYIVKIYRFVYFKVDSQETAQDITAEVFLRCWTSINETDKDIENMSAFLYQIARNLIIDFYRKKEKTKTIDIENCPDIKDTKIDLEKNALLTSEVNRIKKALANIKEDYQDVIIWHYLDDLSIKETAKLLERTEEATRVLLHRALKALREQLKV